MTSRLRRTTVTALLVGATFLLQLAAPLAHFRHQHVYCSTHHALEEAGALGAVAAAPDESPQREDEIEEAESSFAHVATDLALESWDASPCSIQRAPSRQQVVRPVAAAPRVALIVAPIDVLARAPKASPPLPA